MGNQTAHIYDGSWTEYATLLPENPDYYVEVPEQKVEKEEVGGEKDA